MAPGMRKEPSRPTTEDQDRSQLTRLGWLAWSLFAALTWAIYGRGIPIIVRQIEGCGQNPCPIAGMSFTPGTAPSSAALRSMAIYMVTLEGISLLILCALAMLLRRRQSDQRIALVVAFMLVGFSGAAFNPTISAVATLGGIWYWSATFTGFVGSAAILPFLCMLPDGRFVPTWTRWVAGVWLFVCFVCYFLPPTPFFAASNSDSSSAGLPLLAIFFFVTIVFGQVKRYRYYATPHQRMQIKWVVGGLVAALGCLLITILGPQAVGLDTSGFGAHVAGNALMSVILLMIPASIVVAIVKTHLWDIDRIINRALVFGGLSASLIGVYVGAVLLFQRLLNPLTGESNLTIALSTLLVAALFNPARHRIQAIVDQRFYRQKYDAEQALASFGLAARDEVDLERLTGVLAGVISETVQPTHLTVWLRDHEPASIENRERAS